MRASPATDSTGRKRLAPEARRAQILQVAHEVFSEQGYGASMGDVAKRAGVTRTVLYHYFATKEDLFLEVADRLLTELLRVITPAATSDDPAVERARASLEALLEFTQRWPDAWNVLLPRGDDADPEVVAMRQRVEDQLLITMADLVSADLEEAGIDPDSIEAQVVARSLLGGAVYVLEWWRAHPEVEVRQIIDPLFRAAWTGVAGLSGINGE